MRRANSQALAQEYPLMTGAVPASARSRFFRIFFLSIWAAIGLLGLDFLHVVTVLNTWRPNAPQNILFAIGIAIVVFEILRQIFYLTAIFTGYSLGGFVFRVRIVHIKTGKARAGFFLLRYLISWLYVSIFAYISYYLSLLVIAISKSYGHFGPLQSTKEQTQAVLIIFAIFSLIPTIIFFLSRNQYGQTIIDQLSQTIMISIRRGRDTHRISVEEWQTKDNT